MILADVVLASDTADCLWILLEGKEGEGRTTREKREKKRETETELK